MLDYLNSSVCALLLALTFPVAHAMRRNGVWLQRLVFIVVVILLAAQILAPFNDFLPTATWLQFALNFALLIATLLWREEIMTMVHRKIGELTASNHPMRRWSDHRSYGASADAGDRHGLKS